MRSSNKLTELTLKQIKPPLKQRKLSDGGGMYLLLLPNGSRYWQMKYRMDQKQKTISFGVSPEVSLKEARAKRSEARKKIQEGIDPMEERKEQKKKRAQIQEQQQRTEVQQTNTFEKVAQEWLQRQMPRWTEKHAFDVKRGLELHVFPHIGASPITELGTQEVLEALRKIEAQGKHEAAHRARQRCEAVFRYGIITGICERNPASDLRGALTPPQKKKQAALKPEELPEFFRNLEQYSGHPLTKLAMRFMLLTFVRTNELRNATWEEFECEGECPLWKIPASRMKMRRPHEVPLSFQAIEVLEEIQIFSGEEGLVFPQVNNEKRPMSENTLLFALYRMGYHSRATTHGFRATASTILNESGVWHPDAIERQLAHVEGNKTRAAYNRAEHLEERTRMMQWWADHLDSLQTPAGMIDLETERKRRTG